MEKGTPLSSNSQIFYLCLEFFTDFPKFRFWKPKQKILFVSKFYPSISLLSDNDHLILNFSFPKVKELESLAII